MGSGADPHLKNKDGETPLQKAKSLNQGDSASGRLQKIVDYLERTKPVARTSGAEGTAAAAPRGAGEPALHVRYMALDLKAHGNPDAEAVRRVAKLVLSHRGWRLLASEPDRDVGKLVKKWEEYRAEIRMLDNDQVRIA